MSSKAALVIPALKRHTASVIIAHGLGDSGVGWAPVAENWRRRGKFEEVSFIFPNAPVIPITTNMGMRMPGWYDIVSQRTSFDDLDSSFDEPGILRSRNTLISLITAEIQKGIPSNRILLGGFSQGGAMSLLTGISCPVKLGGIFGMSCYMLMPRKIRSLIPEGNPNEKTRIWMGHGLGDPLVKYEWGRTTAKLLEEWGWDVELKSYSGLEHSASLDEIDDLEDFIQRRLTAIPFKEPISQSEASSNAAEVEGSKVAESEETSGPKEQL